MTSRERFNNQMHCKPIDRCFNFELGFWQETLNTWNVFKRNGITTNEQAKNFFGFDHIDEILCPSWMQPECELIIDPLDWYKVKKERFVKYDPIRCFDIELLKKKYADRDYPLGINYHSLVGRIRNLLDTKGFCLAIYDYPEIVEDMVETTCQLIENSLDKILPYIQFDFASGWEDVCGKNGCIFSPKFFRDVLMPRYKRINVKLRKYGIDIFYFDCDGDVRELIPLMLECGINTLYPYEVSCSGMPYMAKDDYGVNIIGGVDKMCLIKGEFEIRKFMRVIKRMGCNGFIPTADHLVSPDIKEEDFMYYLELKNEM